MRSSSTASTTAPRALAASTSRISAARISASVASLSDASRRWEIWPRITPKSPPPSSARMSPNVPAYHSVRRTRSRVSGCMTPLGPEAVAGAPHRVDQLGLEGVVYLPSEATDQDLEHVGERVVILVPDERGERGAVHHLALLAGEALEQGEFLGRQVDVRVVPPHRAGAEIQLEIRDPLHRGGNDRPPPLQRGEPGQELAKGEGLGQVIVRARVQPADPVIHRVAGREHQDGSGDVAGAELAAQVIPVAAGQEH